MVTVETRGEIVTLGNDAKWQDASPALLEKLEAVCVGVDVSGADPAPDVTWAQEVVRQLGGRIIWIEEEPDEEDDPNLPPPVYSSTP